MKKKRRIIRKAAALLALVGVFTSQVFAASLVETASAVYFQRAYGNGSSWEDREEKEYHVTDAEGAVVYCLESGKSFSTDAYTDKLGLTASTEFLNSSYVQANLNVTPEAFLKGLLYIVSYGFPNYLPDGLTEEQARYATSAAVHTFVAKSVKNAVNDAGRGKFGYSVYAHLEPGNTSTDKWLRAKPGVEGAAETFEWFQTLYKGALEGQEMPHSLSLSKTELVLAENGNNFKGSVKVSLKNMNYGYRIDAATKSAIRAAGGIISGYTGEDGDTLTVTIPKKGNTNKTFTLGITAKDNRSLENMAFWVPQNTTSNQTLAGIYAAGSSGSFEAEGNLTLTASAELKTGNYGLQVTVKKASSDSVASGHPLYSLSGAKFKVSGKDAEGNSISEEISTGADGSAVTTKKFAVGSIVTVKETAAPEGFALNSRASTLTVSEESGDNVITMKDDPLLASADVKIAKVDSSGENSAITWSSAVFRVEYFTNYDCSGAAERTWYFRTGSDGMLSLSDSSLLLNDRTHRSSELYLDASGKAKLPLGSIRVTEVEAPEGYTATGTVMKGKISASGSSAEFSWERGTQSALAREISGGVSRTDALVVGNSAKLFGVKGAKLDAQRSSAPSGDASLKGAEISVINRSERAVVVDGTEYAPGSVCAKMNTAADGSYSLSAKLPCGSYELKETGAPAGYLLNSSWSWSFSCGPQDETGKIFEVPSDKALSDSPVPQTLKIRKWDSSRGTGVTGAVSPQEALEGIRFEVLNASQNPVVFGGQEIACGGRVAVISTVYDAQTGEYSALLEGLPYGTYSVRELEDEELGSGMANAWYLVDDGSEHTVILHADGPSDSPAAVLDLTDSRLYSVTVSKTVEGNMGSRDRQFSFEFGLSENAGHPVGYAKTDASGEVTEGIVQFTGGKYSFTLAHGESIAFSGIVSGRSYTLAETGAQEAGYTVEYSGETSGTVDSNKEISVVNTRESVVTTGLVLPGGRAEISVSSAALGAAILAYTGKKDSHGRRGRKKQG